VQQSGYRVNDGIAARRAPEDAAGTTLIFAEPSERGSGAERAAFPGSSPQGAFAGDGASGASFAPQSAAIPIPDSIYAKIFFGAAAFSPEPQCAEVTMVAPDEWEFNWAIAARHL